MRIWLVILLIAACTKPPPKVPLVEDWPAKPDGTYRVVTSRWTRISRCCAASIR